jgi:hypothetical protein
MSTLLDILVLCFTFLWYAGAIRDIEQKRQYAFKQSSFFKRPIKLIREGNDAVKAGKIQKYFAIFQFIITILGLFGVHDYAGLSLLILAFLQNILVLAMYPMKPEYPEEAGSLAEKHMDDT